MALVLLVALAAADTASARVAKPRFVRNIDTGETGWFSSSGLVDLTGDEKLEIVAPFYSTFVYTAKGRLLGKGTASEGRVYAPGVVADLDRDGVTEIVVGGNDGTVAAYNLGAGGLTPKAGWPASTCSGGIDVYRVKRSNTKSLPWPTRQPPAQRRGLARPTATAAG